MEESLRNRPPADAAPGEENIREVIPFPKTATAVDSHDRSAIAGHGSQLDELHIKLKEGAVSMLGAHNRQSVIREKFGD